MTSSGAFERFPRGAGSGPYDAPTDPGPPSDNEALYDAAEYLVAGLDNQAEWWEHLGDAHRDYAALARAAGQLQAELTLAHANIDQLLAEVKRLGG